LHDFYLVVIFLSRFYCEPDIEPDTEPKVKQVHSENTPIWSCDNYVAGAFSPSENHLMVRSPWTGQQIAKVAVSTSLEVNAAIQKAHEAFENWRVTPLKERTQRLFAWRQIVMNRLEDLSAACSLESGKTHAEAKAGIMKGLEVTEFALSLQNLDIGAAMDVSRGVSCEFRREPLGVVVGIVPFNFPAMVPMWMYPIAITLGNTFILKPSEKVPVTSHLIASCFRDAGFPPGVFQLVHGQVDTVNQLIDHELVKAVGFVGSSPVAKKIYERTTGHGKRALCLGGAKNPVILMPDADESIAVQGIVDSFTGCAGQRCMAASVLLAVGPVDGLIQKIAAKASQIQLGVQMGAIIDEAAKLRISAAIEKSKQEGATILLDGRGKLPENQKFKDGQWLGPTILDHVKPGHESACTEIFGPVISIIRVKSLEEAMQFERQNRYGNAVSIFTSSGSSARYVSERASSSMVGINIGVPVPREPFSFGGSKDSKYGSHDITGESVVDFWTMKKKITTKWADHADKSWMS
jgi:malonate-semialdehyde dehydrogenase (acetylating) / methylmalonate-semialdehyde dehydrogenase